MGRPQGGPIPRWFCLPCSDSSECGGWTQESLPDAPQIRRDEERLREILKTTPQSPCEKPRQASSCQKRS